MNDDDTPTATGTLGPAPSGCGVEPELDERYDLGGVIGRGGMGEVRLAYDQRIDRDVAVKLMRPDQRDDETIARFFREARIQGRLDHPAVVPVHDLGTDHLGNPYFVMKRLAGTTLAEVLAGRINDPVMRERWPRRQLLARFVDVCLAVEFAHTRDIIHRDLKPANIMLGDFGEAYVLDWGLARVTDESRRTRPIMALPGDSGAGETVEGSLLGTPGYMPPEQIRASFVDASADVYALGCILFEIATDHTAVPRGLEALDATLAASCHRPSERFPDLGVAPELDEICARATAAEPTARPTARALAAAVQAYLDGDRDLARRRELANRHAVRAQEALASTGDEARARAMREAGRALVLDANNVEAQGILAQLLLEAPNAIPLEARAEADLERATTRQAVLRRVWRAYPGLVLAIAVLFTFPVHHAAPIVLLMAMTAATGAAVWWASRAPRPMHAPVFLLAIWLNALTCGCASLVFGPLLIAPLFVLGSLGVGMSQPSSYRPRAIIVPHGLAIVAPLALEWLGVLPSTYHVDGGLVLTPWAIELTPALAIAVVLTSIVAQGLITASVAHAQCSAHILAQDRLHAHTWHLRQLMPKRTTGKHSSATGDEPAGG